MINVSSDLVTWHWHITSTMLLHCRVGIRPSTVEVRFEDLTVKAGIYVGSRSMSTLLNEASAFHLSSWFYGFAAACS